MAEGYSDVTWINGQNGYCKMSDGTLIQWGNDSISVNQDAMNSKEITYSIPFVSTPIITCGFLGYLLNESNGYAMIHPLGNGLYTTAFRCINHSTTTNFTFVWFAIGRWK